MKACDCRPRILIVDDNEFNLLPLRHLIREFSINEDLMKNGFEISRSSNSNVIVRNQLDQNPSYDSVEMMSEGLSAIQDLSKGYNRMEITVDEAANG